MTLDELEVLIRSTHWFQRLGEPLANSEIVRISTLLPWTSRCADDDEMCRIADSMEWLPSSPDQPDPIQGKSLENLVVNLSRGRDLSRRAGHVYQSALASLRGFVGHPLLRYGPHDFTEVARGAAIYAARRAAIEILLSECGFWCVVMTLYGQGHWPCGILKNRKLVAI